MKRARDEGGAEAAEARCAEEASEEDEDEVAMAFLQRCVALRVKTQEPASAEAFQARWRAWMAAYDASEGAPLGPSDAAAGCAIECKGADGEPLLVQRCLWRVLLFSGTFEASFELEEKPAAGELTYRQLLDPKAFMRELTVQWKVTPTGEDTCSVEHTMFVEPRVNIPAAFRGNMDALLTRQVEGILEDFDAGVRARSQGT